MGVVGPDGVAPPRVGDGELPGHLFGSSSKSVPEIRLGLPWIESMPAKFTFRNTSNRAASFVGVLFGIGLD